MKTSGKTWVMTNLKMKKMEYGKRATSFQKPLAQYEDSHCRETYLQVENAIE